MNRICLVLLGLLVCIWAGCGGSTTTITGPDGEEITTTQDGDRVEMTVEGPDGETLTFTGNEEGVELPDNFPTDVPLYPGATPTSSMTMGEGYQVTLMTSDSTADVKTWYEDALKEGEWESEMTTAVPGTTMLGVSKDQRNLSVTISPDEAEGGSLINLIGN